jgi:hypothetical protein
MAAPQFVPAIAATLRRFHDIPSPVSAAQHPAACQPAWLASSPPLLPSGSPSSPSSQRVLRLSVLCSLHTVGIHLTAALHSSPLLCVQGERLGRTPFARIYEWLDVAEKFTFDDPKVGG